jgi:hypothetical protein
MEDKISLKESQRQWHILLQRVKDDSDVTAPRRPKRHFDETRTADRYTHLEDDDDPFDCSDLRVPSVAGLVDEMAPLYVQEWKDLDDRKIVGILAAMNENNHINTDSNMSKERATTAVASRKRPYWFDKHVRLPEHFDYATAQVGPPPSHADNDSSLNGEDRVLSLQDPTKTTSYHAELWQLFASIPTAQQLEQDAIAGMRLPHSIKLRNEMAKNGVNNKNRDELYGLARLRMSDRHGFPSSLASSSVPAPATCSSTNQAAKLFSDPGVVEQSPSPPVGSIVFECWKRQLKRGCMPDPSRAVLEFLGSQTLYDVHCALVDLTEDEFWTQVDAGDSSTHQTKESEETSGMFFIENIFYTTGSVDYVTPIQDWLLLPGPKSQQESSRRALGLGIHRNGGEKLPVRSMKETRLEEIEMRLGVRYLHVHHGNVECAIFLVDRQYSCTTVDTTTALSSLSSSTATTTNTTTSIASSPFPLLHDVWTPTFATPDCEACSTAAPHSGRGRPTVMATDTTCAVTDGHRALCLDCARQLVLSIHPTNAAAATIPNPTMVAGTSTGKNKKLKLLLQPYAVWRSQADIATDACGDKDF